ncbi:MAG: serine hydrolase [Planctomycetota bacterium]|jgi:CubicO group peptidase (beta-lactamase class C family)
MKITRRILIAIAISLVVPFAAHAKKIPITSPEDVGMSSEKLAQVKPAVQAMIDDEKIAGASIIVARKGKIALFETLGMMDKKAKKPMQPDTIFRFYSMTKPVTSVAAMMLYEEGKLNLDDPVSKYIPEFKSLKVYAESGKHAEQEHQMSVRDLFRHTSGLTYGFFGNTPVDKMYRAGSVFDWDSSLQDMIDKLSEIPLLYQPSTKWHYSVSTDVLGYLVQKISGQSLDKFFKQRIFKPLKMKDTAFHLPAKKTERFAVCYGPNLTGGLNITDDPNKSRYLKKPSILSGGGGLVSTARDYLRFCQMLLNKGQLDGERFLRPETVEMMTKNQLPDSVRRGNDGGFGLGFSVRLKDGKFPKGEYGWGGAASTHFWISPKDELIVIALSQYMPYSGRLENAVKPIVYDSILKPKSISKTPARDVSAKNKSRVGLKSEFLKTMRAKGINSASTEQIKRYKNIFNRVDSDGDKKLLEEEYVKNSQHMTPEVRKRIFAASDRNNDAIVTEQEYVENRIITDEAKILFDKMDTDKNGKLTRKEFTQNSTGNNKMLAVDFFQKMDRDNNGELKLPEYLRIWGSLAKGEKQ